jgi:hypothetical protein
MPTKVKGTQWKVCFSSFTNDATTPSAFHRLCDQYSTTLTVARNSLNYTFGGYVRLSSLRFVPALCLFSLSPFLQSKTGSGRAEQGTADEVGRGRSYMSGR